MQLEWLQACDICYPNMEDISDEEDIDVVEEDLFEHGFRWLSDQFFLSDNALRTCITRISKKKCEKCIWQRAAFRVFWLISVSGSEAALANIMIIVLWSKKRSTKWNMGMQIIRYNIFVILIEFLMLKDYIITHMGFQRLSAEYGLGVDSVEASLFPI